MQTILPNIITKIVVTNATITIFIFKKFLIIISLQYKHRDIVSCNFDTPCIAPNTDYMYIVWYMFCVAHSSLMNFCEDCIAQFYFEMHKSFPSSLYGIKLYFILLSFVYRWECIAPIDLHLWMGVWKQMNQMRRHGKAWCGCSGGRVGAA